MKNNREGIDLGSDINKIKLPHMLHMANLHAIRSTCMIKTAYCDWFHGHLHVAAMRLQCNCANEWTITKTTNGIDIKWNINQWNILVKLTKNDIKLGGKWDNDQRAPENVFGPLWLFEWICDVWKPDLERTRERNHV